LGGRQKRDGEEAEGRWIECMWQNGDIMKHEGGR
jgi:hypothetical protein